MDFRFSCNASLNLCTMDMTSICMYVLQGQPPEGMINEIDLDLILQSIHAFLEPVGMDKLWIRSAFLP